MFCPTCGNAALEKVEMVIGENGAEQYGVRKTHIIRGTKYSLPKPKACLSRWLPDTALQHFCCALTSALQIPAQSLHHRCADFE